jgi:hypothetical protein
MLSLIDPELVPQTLEHLWRIMRPQSFLLFDFLTDPALWPSPKSVYRTGWQRWEMEALIRARLPTAYVIAYDGTEAHAVNRILLKKE